ncbi:hypothetical protein SVAN01_09328 [Stagonosporopsis vannaccii]|nr:hypothetical protein SVAN01_09328 [Stagonosporopsis vannaccii]
MLDGVPASPQIGSSPRAHSCNQVKTSRYSTGIVTTAGWTPLDNSVWQIVRRSEAPEANETGDCTDAEELRQCHEVEVDRYLSAAPDLPHSTNDATYDDHDTSSTEEYLDYRSFFRHAGWKGCASLDQRMPDASEALDTLVQADQTNKPLGAAGTNAPGNWTVFEMYNVQKERGQETTAAEGGQHVAFGVEDLPPRTTQVKIGKAFFHPDEDAWLLLFHSKIKAAAEAGRNIKLPGPLAVLMVFNAFFEGRVLKDERGQDLPPRRARKENSMKGKIAKMHSKIWHLRDETRRLLEGKRGGTVYIPDVNEEELRQYCIDGTVAL